MGSKNFMVPNSLLFILDDLGGGFCFPLFLGWHPYYVITWHPETRWNKSLAIPHKIVFGFSNGKRWLKSKGANASKQNGHHVELTKLSWRQSSWIVDQQCRPWRFDQTFEIWLMQTDTLPETNSLPLKMMVSNRNLLLQGAHIFRGKLLVSGRVNPDHLKTLSFMRSTLNKSNKTSGRNTS